MKRMLLSFFLSLVSYAPWAATPTDFNFTDCIKSHTKECIVSECGMPTQPNCRPQCHQAAILMCRKMLKERLS